MNSVSNLFPDLTASLEDLHAIAVEGQSTDASPDDCAVLAVMIDSGADAIRRKAVTMRTALNGQ